MKRFNLKDVTIVIPIRIDSVERIENLLAVTNHINHNYLTTICVLEAACYDNHILSRILPRNVIYTFVEDYDPIFHRTRYINEMCTNVCTPFIAIWDADIIIPRKQVIDAVEQLRADVCDLAYPYSGKFFDTGAIIRNYYINHPTVSFLEKNYPLMNILYGERCVGGCFIVRKEKYLQCGGENEEFYGWGYEDYERIIRLERLGMRLHRSEGHLYHLSHPRNINGTHSNYFQRERSKYIADCVTHKTEELRISTL